VPFDARRHGPSCPLHLNALVLALLVEDRQQDDPTVPWEEERDSPCRSVDVEAQLE
jgi:hypothetical protein